MSPVPYLPEKHDDELLSSWLKRIERYYYAPDFISNQLRPITDEYIARYCESSSKPINLIDVNPTDQMLECISRLTGYSSAYLREQTLRAKYPRLRDFMFLGVKYLNRSPHRNDYVIESCPTYCPLCLSEQIQKSGENYLKIDWALSLITKCRRHKVYLYDTCPALPECYPASPFQKVEALSQRKRDYATKFGCSLCKKLCCEHPTEQYKDEILTTHGVEEALIEAIQKNRLPDELGGPGNSYQIQYTLQDFINLWGSSLSLPEDKEFIEEKKKSKLFQYLGSVNDLTFGHCNIMIRSKIVELVTRHFAFPEMQKNPMQHLGDPETDDLIQYLTKNGINESTLALIIYIRWPKGFWYKSPKRQQSKTTFSPKTNTAIQCQAIEEIEKQLSSGNFPLDLNQDTKRQLKIAFRLLNRVRDKLPSTVTQNASLN